MDCHLYSLNNLPSSVTKLCCAARCWLPLVPSSLTVRLSWSVWTTVERLAREYSFSMSSILWPVSTCKPKYFSTYLLFVRICIITSACPSFCILYPEHKIFWCFFILFFLWPTFANALSNSKTTLWFCCGEAKW